MLDWDDLKFVLAVARSGAALGASHDLKVNQTTVARRIARIEAVLGATLFEKHQSGYRLTDDGQRVAAAAEAIDHQVHDIESDLASRRRLVTGLVRFTCPETIASHMVAPWLGDFRRLHPEVRIEVINADAMLDLGKGEADVAMRMGAEPTGAGVVARRLPDRLWAPYCSRGYARERGMPKAPEDMREHALVGLEGAQARLPSSLWFEALVGPERIPLRCNSLSNVFHAVRAGLGIAMLPCSIGETQPELIRCLPPVPELNAQTWLIVRGELKSAPHVRAFVDFLAARLAAEVQDRPQQL
ncbi:MAG: LysR family transcriptional regulator [Hyphomicrobiales bacterium]|nr:MAG: LysR family transcriptional regulator [Hyphomicrobiales bacterium]